MKEPFDPRLIILLNRIARGEATPEEKEEYQRLVKRAK